ncbi:hypothetical protein [Rhodopseudomonas sp. RCAM05734]|uniref:hypothetical protein n=1 Tax=Rhodopseudomonas sp. RCAM05734 TaxID=3457549 RepID=UPI00404431A5
MPKAQRYVEKSDFVADLLAGIKDEASVLSFAPKNTVRCTGRPLFRSQLARDVGCLLDIDVSVISWACLPMVLSRRSRRHVPDFAVTRATGVSLVDIAPASAKRAPPDWSSDAAHALGYVLLPVNDRLRVSERDLPKHNDCNSLVWVGFIRTTQNGPYKMKKAANGGRIH